MDELITSLPKVYGSMYVLYNENEGNVMTITQMSDAKFKHWTSYYCAGISPEDGTEIWKQYTISCLRGDVNGDEVVNGTDIQAIINFIVAGEYDEKADVNEDNKVNGTDIQEVINIIVNAD